MVRNHSIPNQLHTSEFRTAYAHKMKEWGFTMHHRSPFTAAVLTLAALASSVIAGPIGAQAPYRADDTLLPFGAQDGSSSDTNFAALLSTPPSTATINIDTAKVLRTVDDRLFGVNSVVWDGKHMTDKTVTDLLNAADNKVLRFPGGSAGDGYHWQKYAADPWNGFDAFAGFAKTLNSQPFITVNYGSGTAQEAADWVTYSNVTQGYGFKYWEIGNEIYGTWEADKHPIKNDPYTYAVEAKDYIEKMKAVDPTIKIGVVVGARDTWYVNNRNHAVVNPRTGATTYGWSAVMLSTLRSLGVAPDFVIYHRYEQWPGQENDAKLLQAAAAWKTDAAALRQTLSDYYGADGDKIEITCTEFNSIPYWPGKQTTSVVNGLYYADAIGELLQTEFTTAIWWNTHNGQEYHPNNKGLYGWRTYGDYGILTSNGDGYPVYYVMKLLSHFARGGDQVVATTSDNTLLAAYSVKRKDGSLSLLLLNKDSSRTLTGNIAVAGFTPGANAVVYSYGIRQDNAARDKKGSVDIAQSTFTAAGSAFSYKLAPYSATVISLAPSSGGVNNFASSINCGGDAVGTFAADTNYTGGTESKVTFSIATDGVANAAPMAVYQSMRWQKTLGYKLTGLTSGNSYTVRLHFAENYFSTAGKRVFNVTVNGSLLETGLDIIVAAGGIRKALVRDYTATADANGHITISLAASVNNASICGIEVLPQ